MPDEDRLTAEIVKLKIDREAALELLKTYIATIKRQAAEYAQLKDRHDILQLQQRAHAEAVHTSMTEMLEELRDATA